MKPSRRGVDSAVGPACLRPFQTRSQRHWRILRCAECKASRGAWGGSSSFGVRPIRFVSMPWSCTVKPLHVNGCSFFPASGSMPRLGRVLSRVDVQATGTGGAPQAPQAPRALQALPPQPQMGTAMDVDLAELGTDKPSFSCSRLETRGWIQFCLSCEVEAAGFLHSLKFRKPPTQATPTHCNLRVFPSFQVQAFDQAKRHACFWARFKLSFGP